MNFLLLCSLLFKITRDRKQLPLLYAHSVSQKVSFQQRERRLEFFSIIKVTLRLWWGSRSACKEARPSMPTPTGGILLQTFCKTRQQQHTLNLKERMKGKEKSRPSTLQCIPKWLAHSDIYFIFFIFLYIKNSLGRVHHEAQVYENINKTRDLF